MTDSPKNDKHMTMKITDFGPISNGTVTIKPLTILLGPNGCGKSHVATLAYAIVKAESIQLHDIARTDEQNPLDIFFDQAQRVLKQRTEDSDHILDSETYNIFVQHKVNAFSDMLSDALLAEHDKLVRNGKKRFVLDITSNVIDGKIQYTAGDTIKFEERNMKSLKFIFKKYKKRFPPYRIKGDIMEVGVPTHTGTDEQELLHDIWFSMQSIFNNMFTKRGIYFPAERGGLIMAQRSLTLHYYNMRGRTYVSSPDPNLAIVATDFLGELLMRTRRTGPFADLATKFEKAAMRGTIGIKGGPSNMPDIVFIQDSEQFPLNASASSVKDMAVFLLYLKYAARPYDMIIFEEPETCLHPTNQILLVQLLAQLVNRGVNIIITTHSPFFVEQLSNFIVAGENHSKNESGSILNDVKLKKDNIAAYNFVSDDGNYKIVRLDVDDEGIPQYEFTRVYDQLYNELITLESEIDA